MITYRLDETNFWCADNIKLGREMAVAWWRTDPRVLAEFQRASEGRILAEADREILFRRIWLADPCALTTVYCKRAEDALAEMIRGQEGL